MGGLMSKPKQAAAPAIPDPVAMPDAEDPTKKLAAQKRVAQRISASGRESTYVSQNQKDKLGS
jgi:hypothetical protein